jgi:hypothetical protein
MKEQESDSRSIQGKWKYTQCHPVDFEKRKPIQHVIPNGKKEGITGWEGPALMVVVDEQYEG